MSESSSPVPGTDNNPSRSDAIQASRPAERTTSPVVKEAPRMRVWPALIIIAVQWTVYHLSRRIEVEQSVQLQAVLSSLFFAPFVLYVWWFLFSRIRWLDRFIGFGLFAMMGAIVYPFMDSTFPPMIFVYIVIPFVTTAAVLGCFVGSFMSRRSGYLFALTATALTWGFFALLRFDGMIDNMGMELAWRRTPTPEDKNRDVINAQLNSLNSTKAGTGADANTLVLQHGDWPCFRGPHRDSRLTGVSIATDWGKNPPREVWRQKMGPSWSSFAVVGDHLYTQSQLDKDEMVICYSAGTGKMIWAHKDKARFVETIGGNGPRATPTFHEGKIYALGATGILNCLDARTGALFWSRDIAADSGAKVPMWGFASSPLVYQGIVTVFAGAPDGKSVLGYKAADGTPAWHGGLGTHSYCSLEAVKLGGVEQLLESTEQGLTSFNPKDGQVLWNYVMETGKQRVVQPAILSDTDVLFGSPFGDGIRRLSIVKQGDTWTVNELWSSKSISPYFNDFVVQGQYLYGFEGNYFTCVSIENGNRKWKARGYGTGQVLLLADQNILLVQAEDGAVALLEANPEKHVEISRFQAIEGKTWNHPVVAHGKLFVRNGEEAACFELREIGASAKEIGETKKKENDWIAVFDGKDLSGWHVSAETGHSAASKNKSGGRWVVEKGVMVGSQDIPGNGGIIITDKKFKNFEVVLEMNNDFGPDSGLFLRCNDKGQCYQAMIDYHKNGNLMGIYGEGIGGQPHVANFNFLDKVTDIKENLKSPFKLPVSPAEWPKFWKHGEWNELKARIEGNPPHITTWIKGVKFMDFQDDKMRLPDEGGIGLQVHGGGDYTKEFVRYRNIRVKVLE